MDSNSYLIMFIKKYIGVRDVVFKVWLLRFIENIFLYGWCFNGYGFLKCVVCFSYVFRLRFSFEV